MSSGTDPRLVADAESRARAVDPRVNVALEASAGTGKTRVLVDRYVNLLRAGVDPRNILAITFTRKAAAEMRQRVLATIDGLHRTGALDGEAWQTLRDRRAEVAISTIDAFCMALLREFPLEADVDPGFEIADETETPRLMTLALDRALRAARARAATDDGTAMVLSRLQESRLRDGLSHLLDRRLVAAPALDRFVARAGTPADGAAVAAQAAARFARVLASGDGGLEGLLGSGPDAAGFRLLRDALEPLDGTASPTEVAALVVRLRAYFLTGAGEPRRRPAALKATFASASDYARHKALVQAIATHVLTALDAYDADINALMARGIRWLFGQAQAHYRRLLDEHAVIDFTDALLTAVALLARMDEFSRSRYRLEARYQHVLVDEFQDTSRAQWQLVALLVQAWGEGMGVAADGALAPSIFVVGDRKQSIYGFRDAEVSLLDEAARTITALRGDSGARRAIARSFRALPPLLAFVNDVCEGVEKRPDRPDAFRYDETDRFPPVPVEGAEVVRGPVVSLVAAPDPAACARLVVADIARRLHDGETVRDRDTGVARAVRPGDIAILFRSRASHRDYERQLSAAGIPSYVYKGLGFFDADEIKDVVALIDALAAPDLDRPAAAVLRSRLVGLSDQALKQLAPGLSAALFAEHEPAAAVALAPDDLARLRLARAGCARWRALVDRMPPAELLDVVLHESAYAAELAGAGVRQARENLKKIRALVRRIQNRGYATMARVAERLAQLMAGDESNAVIDAADAVNLMTVHAAKGLEFPVVYLVHLGRGTGAGTPPVQVVPAERAGDRDAVVIDGLLPEARTAQTLRASEEDKRLLYVALTRARDQLCLAAVLDSAQRFRPSPSSLGAVLPPSLRAVIEQAGTMPDGGLLTWPGRASVHDLRVLPTGGDRGPLPVSVAAARAYDQAPLTLIWRRPVAATTVVAEASGDWADAGGAGTSGRAEAAARGDALHAALAAGALRLEDAAARRAVVERSSAGAAMTEDVVPLVERLRSDARVQALLARPWRHELPFTVRRPDGTLLRGVIDALVSDEAPVVLEFKTGLPVPGHEAQLRLYVEVAAALTGRPATGQLIYIARESVRFVLVSA